MIGHYVIAKQQYFPFGEKLLIGPYERSLAAQRMVMPVRRAMQRASENVEIYTRMLNKKRLPVGTMDLTMLKLEDVIEASRAPVR